MSQIDQEPLIEALGLQNAFDLFAKTRSLKSKFPELINLSLERMMSHGELNDYLHRAQQFPLISHEALSKALQELSWTARLNRKAPLAPLGEKGDLSLAENCLRSLAPWKKGPFEVQAQTDSLYLDAEWQCFKKWERLTSVFNDFKGARVLDIGSGNGYFMLRALGQGAFSALGVEPSLHHVAQFISLKRAFPIEGFGLLPLRAEDLPAECAAFDIVFSMGVLYHRRSPLDHIMQVKSALAPGGRFILETIITDGPDGHAFLPAGRYAQMRNVFFLPSLLTLQTWMKRCGLNILAVDEPIATGHDEQRRTEWMQQPSLANFLDQSNPELTIEGYPAPKRVIIVAERGKMPTG